MERFTKGDCLILKNEELGVTVRAWRDGDLQVQVGSSAFRIDPKEALEGFIEYLREAQIHAMQGRTVDHVPDKSGSPKGTFAELMAEITTHQVVSEAHFSSTYNEDTKGFVLRAIERGLMEWAGAPPVLRIRPGVSSKEIEEVATHGFPPARSAEELEATEGLAATGETEQRAREEITAADVGSVDDVLGTDGAEVSGKQ